MSGLRGPYHTYPEAAESADTSETEYVIVSHLESGEPTISAATAKIALDKWLYERGWTGYDYGAVMTCDTPFPHAVAVLRHGNVSERVCIAPRLVLEGSDA